MNILYKIEDKEVLREKVLSDGFKIILARWVRKELDNKVQYVTWLMNPKTRLTHRGNYFEDFSEANDNFLERSS